MNSIRRIATCFAALLLALTLTGCGNAQPTARPTFTPAPRPFFTSLPPLTAASTPSVTPAPSDTPEPDNTLDATAAAVSTHWAATYEAQEISDIATLDAVATFETQFFGFCKSAENISLSPDTNWITGDCNNTDGPFQIMNKEGHKRIIIPHDKIAHLNDQTTMVSVIRWSNDSRYVYFSTSECCATIFLFIPYGPLYRVDVQSETWSKIVDGHFNGYSFSPSDRHLLYIPSNVAGHDNPVVFHILDLKSGTEQLIRLDGYNQAGDVVWNPNGRSFFATAKIDKQIEGSEKFTLFFIALDEPSVTAILANFRGRTFAIAWADENTISFYGDPNPECNPETEICAPEFFYDVKTKRFVTPTATP